MTKSLKTVLKMVRDSQPFNRAATSTVSAAFAMTGVRSEFVIKHLPRVGVVRRRLPNGRTLSLWSEGDDWVSCQVYWRGWDGYESETIPLFYSLASRAGVTIDVGAFVGYYSLIAAHANPSGSVFAFEPLPTIHERLRGNIKLNGLDNVECVPCAVSDIEGETQFYHMNSRIPSSSSLSFEFMKSTGNLVSSTVPVITLDRYVAEKKIHKVDLVKIDTESTECHVLGGMRKTLERDHPDIFCEVLAGRASEAGLEEILGPLGYRYYLLSSKGPDERPHIKGHPEWLNYLFSTSLSKSGPLAACPL